MKLFITPEEVSSKLIGVPTGIVNRLTLATPWSGKMNSHFQSSEAT